jgi:hypothetical protein
MAHSSQTSGNRYAKACANLVDILEMVKPFVLEESEDYRFIRFLERLLYTNYFPVAALGLPYSRLWAKDNNATQGDDAGGGPTMLQKRWIPTLLQKSHPILQFALTVSPADDSADTEIVSCMRANELALHIAGCGRFADFRR